MARAACTIASLNYLPYARTLCNSFLSFHPDYKFYVLLVDRCPPNVDLKDENFEVVLVEELGIPGFESIAFKYDVLELNTNVKASFLKSLLARGIDQLIYFDPDIRLFQDVRFVFDLLDEHSILLTPHCTSPAGDNGQELEHSFLSNGVFNLGFIGVNSSTESIQFLNWWSQRCLSLGFSEARTGLFVDQKWANLIPCLFENVYLLKHKGCNVAHWNLFERQISPSDTSCYMVNGTDPLIFFHFSGFDPGEMDAVSKKGSVRITLTSRPDLKPLFDIYRQDLQANRLKELSSAKYAFGQFSNGVQISTLARRVYATISAGAQSEDNPFDSSGPFYRFAARNRLIGQADSSQKYDSRNYVKSDSRLRVIHAAFRALLFIFGNDRYTMFLKYLSHFSVLRNQDALFRKTHYTFEETAEP